MALDYNSYVSSLANLMTADPLQPEFQIFLPDCITYSEKRMYRELDLINTVAAASGNLTAFDRLFNLPAAPYGSFITTQGVNVFANGQRVQLQPVSISFLNAVWGTAATAGVPEYFAMLTQDSFLVGPYPNQNYAVEIIGTYRPEPLSITNQTTFITEYLPDLFLAASMVFASGYQRDFGAQSDNPAQSQSWENQYTLLFKGANLEALRQKFSGPAWTSLSAIPVADSR
jgi:hypothetical protein